MNNYFFCEIMTFLDIVLSMEKNSLKHFLFQQFSTLHIVLIALRQNFRVCIDLAIISVNPDRHRFRCSILSSVNQAIVYLRLLE